MEKYVKEMVVVTVDLTKAYGRIFEQEHLRFISMFSAKGGGGHGGGGNWFPKAIMEQKIIQHVRAVSGDKSLFRQWH